MLSLSVVAIVPVSQDEIKVSVSTVVIPSVGENLAVTIRMKSYEKGLSDAYGRGAKRAAPSKNRSGEFICIGRTWLKTQQFFPFCHEYMVDLVHERHRFVPIEFHLVGENEFRLLDVFGSQELLGARAGRSALTVVVPIDCRSHHALPRQCMETLTTSCTIRQRSLLPTLFEASIPTDLSGSIVAMNRYVYVILAQIFLCSLGLMAGCATGGSVVEAERLPENGSVFNAENGREISLRTFVTTLSKQRHIYVGERHREALSHRSQLDILELLHTAGIKTSIAVEWLPVTASEALGRYIQGEINDAEMLEAVGWRRYWGHSFDAYRGILHFARAHKIPIWPLNAPKGMASKIARGLVNTFSDAERSYLTSLKTGNDAHRAYFFKLMAQVSHAHGHGHHGKGPSLENYYKAQLYRDEFMAQSLARYLEDDPEGRVAVVFAGRAHVAYGLGIPQRAAQLGFPGFVIVLPVAKIFDEGTKRSFGPSGYPEKRSDFLWHPRRGQR